MDLEPYAVDADLEVAAQPESTQESSGLFARLCDVELQLCFHPLDALNRLALARCSKQMLRLASQPFAWQHSSPLRIDGKKLSASIPPAALSSLLQHAPFAVAFDMYDRMDAVFPAALLRLERVHALLLPNRVDPELCLSILEAPSIRAHLQRLQLPRQACMMWKTDKVSLPRMLRVLGGLAALHTLAALDVYTAGLPAFAPPPSITAADIRESEATELLSTFARSGSLRVLEYGWHGLRLPGQTRADFCTPQLASSLVHLTLRKIASEWNLLAGADWAALFGALLHLRFLHLEGVDHVGRRVMPHVAAAPRIQHLLVSPGEGSAICLPWPEDVVALLQAAPRLHVSLAQPPSGGDRMELSLARVRTAMLVVDASVSTRCRTLTLTDGESVQHFEPIAQSILRGEPRAQPGQEQ